MIRLGVLLRCNNYVVGRGEGYVLLLRHILNCCNLLDLDNHPTGFLIDLAKDNEKSFPKNQNLP
jgi:hypothetical protein